MNSTSIRRIAVPTIAALTLAITAACGASNESGSNDNGLSGTIKGAGSSAQEEALNVWRAAFQTKNSGVTIDYDPAGSGAGVEQFNAGGIDFAASDAPLDAEKGEIEAAKARCGANALEVPNYVSAIAVVYNLDGVADLQLSAETIGKIFNGKITKWNDDAIKADNPGKTLPGSAITPVHRSDDSGTTKNFTDYLSKVSPDAWPYKADKVWPKDTGEAAAKTSGVVQVIGQAAGSIGYVDEIAAADLAKAKIKVGDTYVAPSADGAAKAMEVSPVDDSRTEGDLAVKVDRTTTAAGAYPLLLASYLIACPTYDAAKLDLVKGFLASIVSAEGQAAAVTAGAAPLPATLQTQAQTIINGITAK